MGILTTDHLIQDDCLLFRMELIKSFVAPTPIFSASLHPSKSCFVAGGDDFKLYKFDYEDGKEIGENTELFKFCYHFSVRKLCHNYYPMIISSTLWSISWT